MCKENPIYDCKRKKSTLKTKLLSWPSAKTRPVFFVLIVLFSSPRPLINIDQSTAIHQTLYNFPSKHKAKTTTMDKTDSTTIQQYLEWLEALTQRQNAEVQCEASAECLEELRQQDESLSSHHLDGMTSNKRPHH